MSAATNPEASTLAAVYSRVSTDEQAGEGKTSLADQERRGRAEAEAKGWEVAGVFTDEGGRSSMRFQGW